MPGILEQLPIQGALSNANPSYVDSLLSNAKKEYGFINLHNPVVSVGKGEGYAETYPPGEEGSPDSPRPTHFPIHKVGIEVYRPQDFTHHDLAGELLHIDPKANEVRDKLLNSLSPVQMQSLKANSGDYVNYVGKLPEEQNIRNAVDGAMRGYLIGQWPKSAIDQMQYTPQQTQMLDALKTYMQTGK
jgi:hypothetical protein